jgi:hypothetical protein
MSANESKTPNLLEIIQQWQKISVDDYQRTYAWSKDEIEELFEDLRDTAKSGSRHFFGTLIWQSKDGRVATLVDGQQRMTTVFLIVAALRDELIKLGKDTIEPAVPGELPTYVLQKAWQFLVPGTDTADHRFVSNRFLRKTLAESVMVVPEKQVKLKDKDTQITLAFRKAVKAVRALVNEDLSGFELTDQKVQRINLLLDTIQKKFEVLSVVTHNLSDSLEIFLTLNNRGVPLGPSDLVRGDIMGALGNEGSDAEIAKIHRQVFEEWRDISDNVVEPEVFLRHYLVSTGTEKVQKKKVFDTVSKRIRGTDSADKRAKAQAFWDDLISASEIYHNVITPKMGGTCQYHLQMLNGLLKSHRIFAMTLLKERISPADRDETVRLLYILCFRWVMSGGNAQKLEDFFQKLSTDLREGASIDQIQESLSAKAVIDFDVKGYLQEEGDSGFVGKAILHSINAALAPGANEVALNSSLHLEHIAPQTETDTWVHDLFEGDSSKADQYGGMISEIGNLTLLDFKLNMKAKQQAFESKKEKYKISTMFITDDLENIDRWTYKEIQARTQWVTDMFELIFNVEPADGDILSFSEWMLFKKFD